jgi:hypothetical protein
MSALYQPGLAGASASLARFSCARPNIADKINQTTDTGTATSAIVASFSPKICKLSNTQP